MGIIIRQSLKASAVTYVGVALGMVNQLFVATKFLSVAELGLTRSLLEFSLFFGSFALLGATGITDRFFAHFRDDATGRHNGFLGFLLCYVAVGFGLFSFTFLGLKQWYSAYFMAESPELVRWFYYIIPFTGFSMLQGLLEAYCRNNQRIAIPALLREVYVKAANIALILAYSVGWLSFEEFIQVYVLMYGSVCIGLLIYLWKLGKLYLRPDWSRIQKPLLMEMAKFGFFVILGAIGTGLCTKLDAFMLSGITGQEAVGKFYVAMLIASLIEIPRRSITQIATPLLAQSLHKNDLASVQELHQKAALNQLILGLFLFLGLWCNLDALFALMPKGDIYREGQYVVLFLAIAKLIDMATGLSAEIIGYSKYYQVGMPMVGLLAVLTWATNSWLIPLYGISGAALATAITLLIYSSLRGSFVWWKFKIVAFSKRTFGVILIGIITFGIVWFIPDFSGDFWRISVGIALRSGIITLVFGGLLLAMGLSPDINQTLRSLMAKITKR